MEAGSTSEGSTREGRDHAVTTSQFSNRKNKINMEFGTTCGLDSRQEREDHIIIESIMHSRGHAVQKQKKKKLGIPHHKRGRQ